MALGSGRNSGEEFVRNLEKKESWCYNTLNMKPEFVREENDPVPSGVGTHGKHRNNDCADRNSRESNEAAAWRNGKKKRRSTTPRRSEN